MMKRHASLYILPVLAASFGLHGPAQAQSRQRTIPVDTVIRLELNDDLSSRNARRGDLFTARLDDRDHSGFPSDTRFEGSVIDVRRAEKNRAGVLGIKIHRAILPGGQMIPVNGTLASLDGDGVRRASNGRLEASGKSSNKIDLKWVGYGAAGGAVLGTVLGDSGDLLKGALLGALGGAAYSYLNKDKGNSRDYRDVTLARGTDFGVRVHHNIAFRDADRYRYSEYDDRYAGREDDDRYDDRERTGDRERYNERNSRDRYDRERDDDRYSRDADSRSERERYDDRRYDEREEERQRASR